jgi:hypothetical protein
MTTALKILVVVLLLPASFFAQEIVPGTALPVTLDFTLDAAKVKPGQAISATIAQNVPFAGGGKIRGRSRLSGQVVQAGKNSDGATYLRLRFDRVHAKDRDIAVITSLRALASPWDVQEAQLPKRSTIRGETEATYTTVQVGGDVVFRGGGHVMRGNERVGDPVSDGVLVKLLSVAQPGCESGSGERRLTLWVFSSAACGVYGFENLKIVHPADTAAGEIVLESKARIHLPTGTGLLLLTIEPVR